MATVKKPYVMTRGSVIFDDRGSSRLDGEARVAGYGTEIDAFVPLDDLQSGCACDEIDRSIFVNPDKTNARHSSFPGSEANE